MERDLIFRLGVLVVLGMFFSGCSARDEVPQTGTDKVRLCFSLEGMTTVTKLPDEYLVEDVNIYVVNSVGDVVTHRYAASVEDILLDIYTNHIFTVYAIANAGRSFPVSRVEEILALEQMEASLNGRVVPMSGVYGPKALVGGSTIVIPLTRVVAKVVLKCNFSQLNEDVSMIVKSVALKNVPVKCRLFGENRASASADVKGGEKWIAPTVAQLENGIEMFLMENKQGTLQPENTVQSGKVWPQESLYSQICSYVEIVAAYASDQKEGDVVYRFYLGSDPFTNYDVERNTKYTISVTFKGNGGLYENSWRVDVGGLDDVVPANVEFEQSGYVMYDMEEIELPLAVAQGKWELEVSSSDPSVVQVVEFDRKKVKVKALQPGTATVIASLGGATASCSIDVEKLRIVPANSSVSLYNHFYEDIVYAVYPPHAADKLEVRLVPSNGELVTGYNGVRNRVIPQIKEYGKLPAKEEVVLEIVGRSDVSAKVDVVVNPMLEMENEISVNVNLGSSTMYRSLNLKTSGRAEVDYGWLPNDGVSVYGYPGVNIMLDAEAARLSFPVPNGANGLYRLEAKVIGDDGYGSNASLHAEAVQYCDVTVYETVYLVGVSKTMGKERISANPETWKYTNEVVAKWLSHPNSLLFPNGEVYLDYGFIYKGVTYEDSHTEFLEEFIFTFEKGEMITYVLEDSPRPFNGSIPDYYIDYFYLQPAVSPYIKGNMSDGTRFFYIHSLQFVQGFSYNDPSWKKIFDYIYN